jgi:hypothetical protein
VSAVLPVTPIFVFSGLYSVSTDELRCVILSYRLSPIYFESLLHHAWYFLNFKNRAAYIYNIYMYIGRAYRYPPHVAFYIFFFFN